MLREGFPVENMIGKFTGIYMKIVNQKNDCSVEREEYL
jgi:hypothetical protein